MNPITRSHHSSSTSRRRTALAAGYQKPNSAGGTVPTVLSRVSLKPSPTWLAAMLASGLALAVPARANNLYYVNKVIGSGGVVGTITTDGKVGVLSASDILDWDLNLSGSGGATFHLVAGASGVEVGNNTDVFNPNAGTPDLTADANNIYFNFSATDGGYLGFQTLPFYGGQNYWSCGAFNNSDTAQGFGVVPVLYSDPSSIYLAETGNQVIASAAVVQPQPNSFVYDSFATAKLLQFNGSAAVATTGDGTVLELTPTSANRAGSVFTANHLALDPHDGFGAFFMFRMSHSGNSPAGGLTFTIQSAGSSSLGGSGGGLGYSGIDHSLAVGFGADNAVSVNINGVLDTATDNTNTVEDGTIWYAWVDYEGVAQDLEVRLSNVPARPLAPVLTATVDLPSILGGTNAFVGFTAGTGAGGYQQDILAWKFAALPTTRITGTLALTNLDAGFQISDGVVLVHYAYKVAGHTFTNFAFAPIILSTNAGGQLNFATRPAELVPDSALPDPDAIDEALNSNAEALDANGFMQYAMLATYENSTTVGEGAILSSYDSDSGFPPFLQNADFDTRYPMYEDNYVNTIYDMNQNSYPGLDPDPGIVQVGTEGASDGTDSAPVEGPMDEDGNFGSDLAGFSLGKNVGTVRAQQQVITGPTHPLVITSPRLEGANFTFDFGTVSNQSYTVWANANPSTTNWVAYTNLVGDGYVQKITASTPGGAGTQFYRLSSP